MKVFKYAAVIVTYNRKSKLTIAIDSLLNQTAKPQKIIIIDNASTDGTTNYLKARGYLDNPLVDYRLMDSNLGGSGGFHEGFKYALSQSGFDFITVSDDDAYYASNYFSLMSSAVEAHPNVDAFCGTVKYKDGSIQLDHRRKIVNEKWLSEEEFSASDYLRDFFVDTFSFVGCLLKMGLIKKIGLPIKDYFIYYDDTEYSMRVRKITRILNVSSAVVTHDVATVADANPVTWKTYYAVRNSMLMMMEHSDWPCIKLYMMYHQLHMFYRILTNPWFKGYRRRALYTYWRGYHDALHHVKGPQVPFVPGKQLPY